jgi:hypothetical protein
MKSDKNGRGIAKEQFSFMNGLKPLINEFQKRIGT